MEFWSNDYRKWIHVDGDTHMNWTLVDGKTGVPLSLWELREEEVRALKGSPTRTIKMVPNSIPRSEAKKPWNWDKGILGKPRYRYFKLVPRSNFLEKPTPVPLSQGKRGWFWTGYYVGDDRDFPAQEHYGNRVMKRGNIEWTLNQARYVLEATATPGVVRVHLDTVTPGFDTFLADVDGKGRKPVAPVFTWKLHEGENRLEVLPRNIAGREGISSWITLRYGK